jgi:hypothetical protein
MKPLRNHFLASVKLSGNEPALASQHFKKGISKMIMFKIVVAIIAAAAAGGLLLTFAPDFSTDLALAAITFFG